MITGHSPSPWQVNFSDEPYGDIEVKGGNRSIAKLWLDDAPVHDYNEQQRANARLISAAPDLLEALENLVDNYRTKDGCMKTLKHFINEAEKAIAKAEGKL